MKRQKAKRICTSIRKSSVAVIGDLMLDKYFWGQVKRISPEAPVPVVNVERTDVRPGGAANVAWNLISLGCTPKLVSILGRDMQAKEIKRLLSEQDISTEYVVSDQKRVTTEKIRIVAHHQQVVRADFESGEELSRKVTGRLCSVVRSAVRGTGAVVISDYGKGVVSMEVMDTVRAVCREEDIPLLIDPKEGHFDLYRNAWGLTPNLVEAGDFYNTKIQTLEELDFVGKSLLNDLDAKAVLITRGEQGMTLYERGKKPKHFPTMASEVYDVTGAGDTVISVLAAGLAAKVPVYDAIELANAAAGIVVRELGTATVSREELTGSFPV